MSRIEGAAVALAAGVIFSVSGGGEAVAQAIHDVPSQAAIDHCNTWVRSQIRPPENTALSVTSISTTCKPFVGAPIESTSSENTTQYSLGHADRFVAQAQAAGKEIRSSNATNAAVIDWLTPFVLAGAGAAALPKVRLWPRKSTPTAKSTL